MPIDTSVSWTKGREPTRAKERLGRWQDDNRNLLAHTIMRVLNRLSRLRVKQADEVGDRRMHNAIKPTYQVFVLNRNSISSGVLLPVPGNLD